MLEALQAGTVSFSFSDVTGSLVFGAGFMDLAFSITSCVRFMASSSSEDIF